MTLIYFGACFFFRVSRFTHFECHLLWLVTHPGICLCHLVNFHFQSDHQSPVKDVVRLIHDNEVNFFHLFCGKNFTQGQPNKECMNDIKYNYVRTFQILSCYVISWPGNSCHYLPVKLGSLIKFTGSFLWVNNSTREYSRLWWSGKTLCYWFKRNFIFFLVFRTTLDIYICLSF